MKNKLSAVILARNEEKNISKVVNNLSFCDEVLIIDDCSIDGTSKVAKKLGAKIYIKKLNNNFSSQRNFGLKKAKNDWVLFVDADERATNGLKSEIKEVLKNPIFEGYKIRRRDYFHGELKGSEFGANYLLRLGKKGSGKWKRNVHEYWDIQNFGFLKSELAHNPHRSLEEFVRKINFYSKLHAESLSREGKYLNVARIIINPVGKFIYNFIFKLGFLDGTKGFVLIMLMSFHSFLAWSNLWLSKNKKL